MKDQTFGVEIEMNHITRQDAAKLASKYFGTGRWENTAHCNGYQTWSAWDQQGREWKFSKDVSIAGPDSEKCEMVTPILKYEDMEMLQELVRRLRGAGAISNSNQGCGVHIHIGAAGHTPKTLRTLANIMAAHEDLLVGALGLDEYRLYRFCRPVDPVFLERLNKVKPDTMEKLADVWYGGNGASHGRDQHYNASRYHMLNLHATFTKGTVEFRLFEFENPHMEDGKMVKGGLHAGRLKSYIQLCLAMSQKAKELNYASAKKLVTDNPKYAMRCWLLRLGFIGDEFKTARDVLTKKLEGDSAWRHGAPEAAAR